MSKYNYSFNNMKENMARAVGRDISISRKTGIEIANHLRGRSTERAKTILENVMALKEAVPYKRFTNGPGHRRGKMASGRYPVKAAKEFLRLIKTAETNAQDKGLSIDLNIIHLSVQKASQQFHYGRQRRRLMKRAHVELVVEEQEGAKRAPVSKKEKKEAKKEEKKAEVKPKKESKSIKDRFIRSEDEKKALEDEVEPEVKEEKKEVKPAKETAPPKEESKVSKTSAPKHVEKKPMKKVEEKPKEVKKEAKAEKTEKKEEAKEEPKKEPEQVPKPAPSAEKEK